MVTPRVSEPPLALMALAGEDPREAAIRRRIARIGLVALALLALALWLQIPYLAHAHRRLEPWQVLLLSSSDILGVLWCVRFFAVYFVFGQRFLAPPSRPGLGWFPVVGSVLLALLLQCLLAVFVIHAERTAYERATATTARADRVEERPVDRMSNFIVHFHFSDAAGRVHHNTLILQKDMEREFPRFAPPHPLPRDFRRPFDFRLRFDPARPARVWFDGRNSLDFNHLAYFCLMDQLLEAVFLAGAIALYLAGLKAHVDRGTWPWWHETYRAFPILIAIVVMLITGVITRLSPMGFR